MKKVDTLIASLLVVIAATFALSWMIPNHSTSSPVQYSPIATSTTTVSCTSLNGLPDPICTPGAVNPNITQANINQTICYSGWSTSSIRPPVSYTNPLKAKQIVEYGYADTKLSDYEEDHLISLELGGSPTSTLNLWPEAYYNLSGPGAKTKDTVENLLHKEVCDGQITLVQAQQDIATHWSAFIPDPAMVGASPVESNDPDDN